jgi:hypothetical protein
MKLTLKQIIGVALLAAANGAQADCCSTGSSSCSDANLNYQLTDTASCTTATLNDLGYGKTFFAMRPQHSNVAREQMGTAGRIHQFAKEEFHGDLSLALEWSQSTEADKLGSWFFFNGTNSMTYGPNRTANNNTAEFDVNGLFFGTTASGTIVAKPRVQNLVADFQLYLGFDEFISGLWAKVGAPVNYVRTDMRLEDTVSTAAGAFEEGDVSNVDTDTPYANLAKAWVGDTAVGMLPVLNYGKIDGRRSETKLAGLAFTLGYDFLRREHGSLGLALRAVAPTGNTPCAKYLLEPVSGANNCWEVGGALNGAYELWNNNDDANLNIFVDAQVTHLGRKAQRRIHGLKNLKSGYGASWITLKQFDSSNTFVANGLERAANKLALMTKIGSSFMADAAAQLKYNRGNYGFAVGYNFWHRAKEEAEAREASAFATVNYGIKDAASLAGSTAILTTSAPTLAAKATSSIAQSGASTTAATAEYITEADVDVCPALHPSASSHKVFGSIEYNWRDNEWEPYLLIGGGYEFACKTNSTKNAALEQWSVMAKGGIAF